MTMAHSPGFWIQDQPGPIGQTIFRFPLLLSENFNPEGRKRGKMGGHAGGEAGAGIIKII
ncbi:MAG: hypothetical protein CVV64_09805 [Candidatus Wallbacteria bacterium HGW-Wallbacteria-1]|jgi:hypothetical protein|uniref:Uncharacterized protein n=1 Tax=Candidatus Wallbacteria bacterium HGW-Wallbacteria-1 TaxID=2013854 RepID=A0A2N1PQU5_9BACT|nr:MAG: hypothetical protein CVV64_09805 [Candidatus Wallbacteria bacterium HGW-Wallbacteria-1]